MRILDENTRQEVTNPDLAAGYLYEGDYVAPEAYEQMEREALPALPDGAFERVYYYHVWTPEEIAQREQDEREAAHQELIDALPDAVAELSEAVSDTAINTEDVMDALAELSEIVSSLLEGE